MNITSLVNLFHYVRYSVGIAMLFNGFPLVFFIRDTLHIGPASNVFTAMFFGLALLLMTPGHLFFRLYKPNFQLFNYASLFFLLIIYHFFLYNPSAADWFLELGNLGFTVIFMILLIHLPNDIKDTLMPVLFFLSLFSNLTLIYSLITDPNWSLGMRAAVTFVNEDAQQGGNPHMAARNGLVCLLTGLILSSKYKGILVKLLLAVAVLFSMAVIILAQVKSALLAICLMIFFYMTFQLKIAAVIQSAKRIFTVNALIIIALLVTGFNMLLSRYYDVYSLIIGYWITFQTRIVDVFYTAFGVKISKTAAFDASTNGRVIGFNYFVLTFKSPEILLIGNGYKSSWMDVPILEATINHGIFGFIFFGGFNFYLLIYTIRELRNPTNPLTLFLAYFFIYFIVLLVSNGRPYEVAYWFPYVVMIRFLGIKYLDSPKYAPSISTQPEGSLSQKPAIG